MKDKIRSRPTRRKAISHAGYGFRYKGARGRKVRVEDPDERKVMGLIVEWHDQEKRSWKEIALRLLRQRIVTKKGRTWSPARCRRAYFAELELRSLRQQLSAPKLGLRSRIRPRV